MALLPFSYAFGAGMVSTVNPCGFAMLPAYLSLYVVGGNGPTDRAHIMLVWRALIIGIVVTLGFITLFGVVGLGITSSQ